MSASMAAQQVRDGGGEATIIHVTEIEGLGSKDIVRQFNEARAVDYAALLDALNGLIAQNKKKLGESYAADLERFTRQFEEIRKLDFFDCSRAQDAQMLLNAPPAYAMANPKSIAAGCQKIPRQNLAHPATPEVDRVGSAWLICKFIDPKASFIFSTDPAKHRDAIPYDMFEVEFSHHGDDCTFETLVKRFGITDKAILKIAEMVHDADLEDGKFQTAGCHRHRPVAQRVGQKRLKRRGPSGARRTMF